MSVSKLSFSQSIIRTPTIALRHDRLKPYLPPGAEVFLKLELFQQAGSFKARGVVRAIAALSGEERARGVTAVSAGNHALAVSWGAKAAGLDAVVCMPKMADPIRVAGCEALGAQVVLCENVEEAFAECDRQVSEHGRTLLHPFESEHMMSGAADVGMELSDAVPDMDYAIIPVGGGGLIAGMSRAIAHAQPDCTIIGAEPEGANAMQRSFDTGETVRLSKVDTIADSLGAPMTLPQTLGVTRAHVSEIVALPDDDFRQAMRWMFDALKLVAEPACASTLAALCGPLRESCSGKRVGILACGSNIGIEKFTSLLGGTKAT